MPAQKTIADELEALAAELNDVRINQSTIYDAVDAKIDAVNGMRRLAKRLRAEASRPSLGRAGNVAEA